MNIKLENLTPRQVLFAEILWNMQSADAVTAYIKLTPEPYKHDIKVVHSLLVAAVFDQHEATDLAESVLDKFRK
jgi:hypothetical protein